MRFAISILFLLALSSGASAQWLNQEGPTSSGTTYSTLTGSMAGQYGLMLRCHSDGTLDTLFLTQEDTTVLTVAAWNGRSPEMLIRIDDEQLTYPVELYVLKGKLSAEAKTDRELLMRLAGAEGRLAVALRWFDQLHHETKFPHWGATEAVGYLIDNCAAAS